MDDKQTESESVCDADSSLDNVSDKAIEQLCKEFNYDYKTFWDEIPKACVVIQDQSTIVTATKDLIAGLFLKEKPNEILSLALDLSFYMKCSSSAQSFLYEKVLKFVPSSAEEDEPAELIVNLTPRGWFDKWIKKSPKVNRLGEKFLELFKKTENDAAIFFFGPWLATVFLRLEKRQPLDVANKIDKFFNHISINRSAYYVGDFYLSEKFSTVWEPMLKRFSKSRSRLFKEKRNSIYRAMIEVYLSLEQTDILRGLLNLTTLQTLEYGGMTLVNLTNNCCKSYESAAKLTDIFEVTRIPDTETSWLNYLKFCEFFDHLSQEERYYLRYAREFDSNVFENLSYAKNMKLCNYLAVMIDIARNGRSEEPYTESDIGSTYKQLISNRTNVELLTNDDFRFCSNAAEDLKFKSKPITLTCIRIVAKTYREHSQELQKDADEALKVAQFKQMRADKYRKKAEEYEKILEPRKESPKPDSDESDPTDSSNICQV